MSNNKYDTEGLTKKVKYIAMFNVLVFCAIVSVLVYYKISYVPYHDLNWSDTELLASKGDLVAKYIVGYSKAVHEGNNAEAEKWFDCKGVSQCVPGEMEYLLGLDYAIRRCAEDTEHQSARHWMRISKEKGYPEATMWLNNYDDLNRKN